MTIAALRFTGAVIALSSAFSARPITLAGQAPPHVTMERAGYLAWLKEAANSPLFAVAQRPVGTGLRLGPPDADIPLDGIGEHRLTVDGAMVVLAGPTDRQQGGRNRSFQLGSYTLYLSSTPSGPIVTVFGQPAEKQPPGYYPYDPSLVFIGPMFPPEQSGKVRVLGADGIEIDATEAGTVLVPLGGRTRLRVLRVPLGGGEESELEIFFRDSSNGDGSYPAGRFVSLIPAGERKFRLDFNLARNPFCAYNSVYACPVPWRGNVISEPLRVGERYAGGGLEVPPAGVETK
jgi:uncharacterized protein DUF1684